MHSFQEKCPRTSLQHQAAENVESGFGACLSDLDIKRLWNLQEGLSSGKLRQQTKGQLSPSVSHLSYLTASFRVDEEEPQKTVAYER